jgi:hypothetical protein
VSRWEQLDADREAEALARIDELTAKSEKPRPAQRRVPRNAVTALWARFNAAFVARDDDALADCFSESFESTDHSTGTTYGRDGVLDSVRRLRRSRGAELRHEALATLGESLALARRSVSATGTGSGRFDVGPYEGQGITTSELDDGGRFARSEHFSLDRMGDGVVRLYDWYADEQPVGPARNRATAIGRSMAAMLATPDLALRAAAFAPEIEFIDHRIVGVGSVRGANAVLRAIGALHDLVENVGTRFDDVIDVRPDAIVLRWTHFGTTRDGGGRFERSLAHLWIFGADGMLTRWEQTEGERVDELLARLDALLAVPLASGFENAAAHAMRAFERCWRARDWAGARATFHDAHQMDDRRKLMRLSVSGETFFANERMLFEDTASDWQSVLLATRGERLALFRVTFTATAAGSGPMEVEMLDLVEVDTAGRRTALVVFDTDDLDAAHAELDARFDRTETAWVPVFQRMFASRDWDAFPTLYAPNIAGHDHRPVGWGKRQGVAARIQPLHALVDLARDVRLRLDHLRTSDLGELFQGAWVGTRDGGPFEIPIVAVHALDEHRKETRFDLYDPAQIDQALARFDELRTAAPPRSPFANAATRAADRLTKLVSARDWQGYVHVLGADSRYSDRRKLALLELDRDGVIEFSQSLREVSSIAVISELIATRGNRLALVRWLIRATGGDVGPSEIDTLSLFEMNDRGEVATTVRWDADDLDAAYAELEARFDAGEAAEHPLAWSAAQAGNRALSNRDWEAFAALFRPDLVGHDRRLLGWGTLHGPAAWVEMQRVLVDLAPDVALRRDHVRISTRGLLRQISQSGTRDGGAFERTWVNVAELDEHAKIRRIDLYDLDQLDQALARFAEISAARPPRARSFANAATTVFDQIIAFWSARDWDGYRRLLPPEFRTSDRRRMVLLELDRDQLIAHTRQLGDMGSNRIESDLLATRGDRLSLSRGRIMVSGDEVGPSEIESLFLHETNERGQPFASVRFDADDLDAAYAELDARYDAGEARQHARAWAALREVTHALDSRDWSALLARPSSFRTHQDHRPLGFGTLSAAEGLAAQRALVDLAPDVRYRWDHLRLSERGCLLQMMQTGTREGGVFENESINVYELDATGKFLSTHVYDVSALEQARAHFEAIGAAEVPRAEPFANAATRAWQARNAAWVAGDWERFAQLTPIGFRCLDRRRMFLLDLDREQYLEFARSLGERRARGLDSQVLATRGDRLALTRDRTLVSDAEIGPSESERLNVIETDERGEAVAIVRLDPDDLDAAHAELDARYDAGEAANNHGGWAQLRALHRAVESRDWEAVAALCASDLVRDDHRLLGFADTGGPAAFVEVHRALVDLAPDARPRYNHVRTCNRGSLFECVWHGSRDGGAFEILLLGVSELDLRGAVCRYDIYDLDQLDHAEARFAELAPDPLRIPPNAATRAGARQKEAFEARDWAAIRAQVGEGFGFEDRGRRALISGDFETWLSSMQFNSALPGFDSRIELIGTVGDRLALYRMVWTGGSEGGYFENARLRVVEVDAAGKLHAMIFYDGEDRREAFSEAQRRFSIGEAAGFEGQAAIAAFNTAASHMDWAAMRERMAPDAIYMDHRILGLGTLTADAWIESVRALIELAPDVESEQFRIVCWDRRGRVAVRRNFGTNLAGGPFENVFIDFALTDGERIQRLEIFDLDDLERAIARFAEHCASRAETAK